MSSTTLPFSTSHTGLTPPSPADLLDITTLQPHTFVFPQLATNPNIQPRVRLLMFFKRLPHISESKFHTWWETVHADLTVSVPGFRKHVRRYAQLHVTPHWRDVAAGLAGAPPADEGDGIGNGDDVMMRPLGFDACGEMVVDSVEQWQEFASDPEFANKLLLDAANFMLTPIYVFASYENLIVGPAIPESGGRDGLGKEELNEKLEKREEKM